MVNGDYQVQFNLRAAAEPAEYAKTCLAVARHELHSGNYPEAIDWAAYTLTSLKAAHWTSSTHQELNDIAADALYIDMIADALLSRSSNTAQYKACQLLSGRRELRLERPADVPGLSDPMVVRIVWESRTTMQRHFVFRLAETHWRLMPLRRRYIRRFLSELLYTQPQ